MSRNRKHQTAAVRFGPALKALGLCIFLGGSGVGYVWQKDQINILADRLKQADARYEQQRKKNERLARVLAGLQTHSEIEAQIKRIDLGLVAPLPDQIVRIIEGPVAPETTFGGGQPLYAATPAAPLTGPESMNKHR
jgi:hypothetical protein